MDDLRTRLGDGYLTALGYLQIGAGALTITMSLMALVPVWLSHAELFNPATVFGLSAGFFDQAISAYVTLQLSVGWVLGALQLIAGIRCLKGANPRFIRTAAVVSLANFPHGTMAAILMLHGFKRVQFPEQAARPMSEPAVG